MATTDSHEQSLTRNDAKQITKNRLNRLKELSQKPEITVYTHIHANSQHKALKTPDNNSMITRNNHNFVAGLSDILFCKLH